MCNLRDSDQQHSIPNIRKMPAHKQPSNLNIKPDLLAQSTVYTKILFSLVSSTVSRVKNTRCCRIVTESTQPAHIAAMSAVVLLLILLSPPQDTQQTLSRLLYLTALAVHFGSQIWMTFCSGLSLYFNLPRHHFGEVQKVLFPLYFTLTSCLSFVTVVSRRQLTSTDLVSLLLAARFIIELFVRLYLCEPLVQLINTKNAIEVKAGLGMEVGTIASDSQLFSCPVYSRVYKQFRGLHMRIALANMACIALSTAHLYYAAQHIHIHVGLS